MSLYSVLAPVDERSIVNIELSSSQSTEELLSILDGPVFCLKLVNNNSPFPAKQLQRIKSFTKALAQNNTLTSLIVSLSHAMGLLANIFVKIDAETYWLCLRMA
jgi:hypothetical protein